MSVVIWLTGLPCSGKTTIAKELERRFKISNKPVQRLDGDTVRETICSDLGFSKEDRDENIKRVSYVANMLAENGVAVISAFVSPYKDMRNFARSICPNFVEVYVKCDLETCVIRDVKGMYAKAIAGEIKDFTGVQDPFEEPTNPDVIVNSDVESVEICADKVSDYLRKKYGLQIEK